MKSSDLSQAFRSGQLPVGRAVVGAMTGAFVGHVPSEFALTHLAVAALKHKFE